MYHSHPLYIHITPIHYRYQTYIYLYICISPIHYTCQNHPTMEGDVSYVMTATIYDMTKTK